VMVPLIFAGHFYPSKIEISNAPDSYQNEVLQTARRTSLEHGRRAVRNRTSEQKARRPHRDAKGLLPAAERRLVEPLKKVPWSVVDRDRSLQILVRPSAAAEGDDCDFCTASSLNVVRSVANH
jgi:hypothetical protein